MTNDRPKRGRPRSHTSREAILGAVRHRLLADGYLRLTIEAVAAEAGVSKATIYRWWKTKGELVLEAAEGDISIGLVPETNDPRADVEAAIHQLVDTFSRPLASIVIFAAIATGESDPVMAQIFRDRYVYPWRVSAAAAMVRALPEDRSEASEVQFLLDVIVGTVFQRTLVLREPNTVGLKGRLMSVIFPI
ncbi:MAG: TetR/AcrR family transcriptional regulator [Silicimonas sp.]|nr:TetR/AcrR family transcriptional regulator [Silicimonas sp.]